jgi:hypothetical protein
MTINHASTSTSRRRPSILHSGKAKQQSITINADLIKERLDVQKKTSVTWEINQDAAAAVADKRQSRRTKHRRAFSWKVKSVNCHEWRHQLWRVFYLK